MRRTPLIFEANPAPAPTTGCGNGISLDALPTMALGGGIAGGGLVGPAAGILSKPLTPAEIKAAKRRRDRLRELVLAWTDIRDKALRG